MALRCGPRGRPFRRPLSSLLSLIFFTFFLGGCAQPSPAAVTATTPLMPTATASPIPTMLPPPQLTIQSLPSSQTPTNQAVPTAVADGRFFQSPEYGIHLSQWWDLGALERDLGLTKEMGFTWIKQKFAWRDIEKEKRQYDWYRPDEIVAAAERYGLSLLVRLDIHPLWSVISLPPEQITANQPPVDYNDFGHFCHTLADRYRGRIAAYQVWNEPNLSREWGEKPPDPVAYTELLRLCYEGIKSADPQAIVISAGLAPTGTQPPAAMPDVDFLQGMYDAGASAYFDVLGVNAPGYKAPPETSPEDGANPELGFGGHRWNVFRHVEDIREIMVQNGDADKQIAILEMGWMIYQEHHPAYTWHGVTEAQQADYLVRAYQYARENWQPWIGLMNTIYLADFDWTAEGNEQYWWSIILPDGTPRPAYYALSDMEK